MKITIKQAAQAYLSHQRNFLRIIGDPAYSRRDALSTFLNAESDLEEALEGEGDLSEEEQDMLDQLTEASCDSNDLRLMIESQDLVTLLDDMGILDRDELERKLKTAPSEEQLKLLDWLGNECIGTVDELNEINTWSNLFLNHDLDVNDTEDINMALGCLEESKRHGLDLDSILRDALLVQATGFELREIVKNFEKAKEIVKTFPEGISEGQIDTLRTLGRGLYETARDIEEVVTHLAPTEELFAEINELFSNND